MKTLLNLSLLVLTSLSPMFGQNVKGQLTHTRGYLTVEAYDSSYHDGSEGRIWYDGIRAYINFFDSSPKQKYSGLNVGKINADGDIISSGTLTAREMRVRSNAGADFVFEETYDLPTLASVEAHIKSKKHLPEIASAEDMKANGVAIGAFQIQLLQKIEELTLYTIAQEKKLATQQKQIEALIEGSSK